jgi:deoxyadenosine/deoxycytidine kinase
MRRIGISGIPGSGKTSLARALTSSCSLKVKTELVSEYARQYLSKHYSIDSVWEQLRITDKQIEWENNIFDEVDIMITDSPIYLGFLYTIDLVDFSNPKDLIAYNDLFKKFVSNQNRYDLIFYLHPVIEPINDGIRKNLHFDETWRKNANVMSLNIFKMFGQKNIIEISEPDMTKRIEFCLTKIFEENHDSNT